MPKRFEDIEFGCPFYYEIEDYGIRLSPYSRFYLYKNEIWERSEYKGAAFYNMKLLCPNRYKKVKDKFDKKFPQKKLTRFDIMDI